MHDVDGKLKLPYTHTLRMCVFCLKSMVTTANVSACAENSHGAGCQ